MNDSNLVITATPTPARAPASGRSTDGSGAASGTKSGAASFLNVLSEQIATQSRDRAAVSGASESAPRREPAPQEAARKPEQHEPAREPAREAPREARRDGDNASRERTGGDTGSAADAADAADAAAAAQDSAVTGKAEKAGKRRDGDDQDDGKPAGQTEDATASAGTAAVDPALLAGTMITPPTDPAHGLVATRPAAQEPDAAAGAAAAANAALATLKNASGLAATPGAVSPETLAEQGASAARGDASPQFQLARGPGSPANAPGARALRAADAAADPATGSDKAALSAADLLAGALGMDPSQPAIPPVSARFEPSDASTQPGPDNRTASPGLAGYLNTMQLGHDGPAAAAPARQVFHLQESIGQAAWGKQLGEIVSISVRGKLQEAEVQVEPRNLGPIQLRMSLDGDSAAVAFSVASAATRDAIEANLPALRDALAASGISLGSATVSAEAQSQGNFSRRDDPGSSSSRPGTEAVADRVETAIPVRMAIDRLVDTFV